jgi:hypothetical protein
LFFILLLDFFFSFMGGVANTLLKWILPYRGGNPTFRECWFIPQYLYSTYYLSSLSQKVPNKTDIQQ